MNADAEMAALEKSLRRRFRVVENEVVVATGSVSLLHPASAEDLINEQDFERDERLPYWAEIWPSSLVLAGLVMRMSGGGRRLIELGCGAGLVATCAARVGFDVTATDYYEDATRFARLNAWRNEGMTIAGVMVDWRSMPDQLGRYDTVLASDVLYERPYGELVAGAIAAVLAPGGIALVADPGRVGRESFLSALTPQGLRVRSKNDIAYVNGAIRQTIACFEVGWDSDGGPSGPVP
jgi:predicted nicotinamide N-methyase